MSKHYIKKGELYRERLNSIHPVHCPYAQDEAVCGDWCALFHQEEKAVKLECAGGVRLTTEDWPEVVRPNIVTKGGPDDFTPQD